MGNIWDSVIAIGILFLLWLFLFSVLFLIIKLIKDLRKSEITEIPIRHLLLVLMSFFAAAAPFAFAAVFVFVDVGIRAFFLKILERVVNTVIGAGLFYGFITTLTVGFGYFFVVASFFFKDKQRRVAAMTGFVTGQFLMFTSVYSPRLHQGLVQPHCLILLFLGSFFVQLFWTTRKTLRNAQFFDLDDLIIIQRRRVLRLQLEFLMSFFVQICNPYLEPDSLVPRLVNLYVSSYDKVQNVFFIRSAFVGWFVGHLFFMIFFIHLFEFIAILTLWLRRNFFEK